MNEMIKVCILGCGRMGKEIIKECVNEGFEIVAAVDAPDNPINGKDAGLISGIGKLGVTVSSASNLEKIIEKSKPDVVIDFTNAEASFWNSKVIFQKGINMVIGTTGFSDEQIREIRRYIKRYNVGAVISPNMSIGVNVFWNLIEMATKLLKDYDIEIIESHHRFKRDAPSGTALKTAEIIADILNENLDDMGIFGRKGISERRKGELGIHAIRAGDIVGEHTVLYATIGERIEIIHRAHSRMAFVKGVIKAVKFIRKRKGIYDMKDVLGIE